MYHLKCKIVFIFGFIFFAINVSGQHLLLNKTITISIVNKRFDTAIKLIQKESKINLSYNSDIVPKNKVVTISASNNRLDKVLGSLLASVDLQMTEVNNQIIITKSASSLSKTTQHNVVEANQANPKKTEIVGKVVTVVDTIFHTIHDTIVQTIYDTIRITVYDTKVIRQSNNLLPLRWAPKFSVDISGAMMVPIFNTIKYTTNSEYPSFFAQYGAVKKNEHGYSFAGSISIRNKRIGLSVGLEYFKVSNRVQSGDLPKNFSQKDSSIVQIDITPTGIFYTYKIDTVKYAVDYNPNQATMQSTYSYWGIPVMFSYKVIETRKFIVGLDLGLIYSHLIKAQGLDAAIANGPQLIKNREGESFSSHNISFITGFEVEYPITQELSFITSCRFRRSFTSRYQNSIPIVEKSSYIYPSISVKYNF